MAKEMDKEITTIRDFNIATRGLSDSIQMYVQRVSHGELEPLQEITEVQLVLPKKEDDKPYLILRAV